MESLSSAWKDLYMQSIQVQSNGRTRPEKWMATGTTMQLHEDIYTAVV